MALKKRSGSGAVTIKQYIYNDQLQFLLPAVTQRETQDSLSDDNEPILGLQEDELNEMLNVIQSDNEHITGNSKKVMEKKEN